MGMQCCPSRHRVTWICTGRRRWNGILRRKRMKVMKRLRSPSVRICREKTKTLMMKSLSDDESSEEGFTITNWLRMNMDRRGVSIVHRVSCLFTHQEAQE